MDSMKCVKLKHQLVDNLNIVYNEKSGTIVFWNKFQLFLFDELKFENLGTGGQLINFEELITSHTILSSNYLLCLDYRGNVYSSPLKFKHLAQKRVKSSFQKREDGVLCFDSKDDVMYSIKIQNKFLYFCIHKISPEFQLNHKIRITTENDHELTEINHRKKYFFCIYRLSETEFIYMKGLFKTDDEWNDQYIVIFSLDNLTVNAFLVCVKIPQKNVIPIKLLTCPSKISGIHITQETGFIIIVSLASGTLIRLTLNSQYKTPEIVHLNTAIHKIIANNDTTFYTDGITMWKLDNPYSESNASYKQFKVKHVKDLIKVGDCIICTTYSKLIYLLPIDDEECYIQPPSVSKYCPSEYVLSNSDCLNKIMSEIEKNNQIIKNIKKEENYLTMLALSNREDIMDEMISYKVVVFDNYKDILKEGPLKLADDIEEYFKTDSIYFLIKIITTLHLQQKFCDILSNIFGNLKIHITLMSDQKVLKTTSIKVLEQLKSLNIVLSLNQKICISDVTVQIKLVTKIPGVLNEKDVLWTALHSKNIALYSEHFIKNDLAANNTQFLKEPPKSINDLIYETAHNHHGQLFKINKISAANQPILWSFYLKLPKNYMESLKNKKFLTDIFNSEKANHLYNEIASEDFLKSANNLCFIIAKERVEIEILNDGISDPLIRVNSKKPEIAFSIRNFFSKLVHDNFSNFKKEFVSNALYESVESLEKAMKTCILNELPTEKFLRIFEQYQRNIIGALLL